MAFTRKTPTVQEKAEPIVQAMMASPSKHDFGDVPDFLTDGFDPLADKAAPAEAEIAQAEKSLDTVVKEIEAKEEKARRKAEPRPRTVPTAAVETPVEKPRDRYWKAEGGYWFQAAGDPTPEGDEFKDSVEVTKEEFEAESVDPEVEEIEEPVATEPAKPEEIVRGVGDNSDSAMVDQVKEYQANINESYVKLCYLLRDMREKKLYRKMGYTDQEEFFPAVLDMSYRQAMFYVSIADAFEHTGVPEVDLIKLGWSKAKEFKGIAKTLVPTLVARILKDGWGFDFVQNFMKLNRALGAETFAKLVERVEAKGLTPEQILEYVKGLRSEAGVADESRETVTFRFSADQRSLMDAAVELGRAKYSEGWDVDRHGKMPNGLVLARILGDWTLSENDALTLDDGIATLETMFGVKLNKV